MNNLDAPPNTFVSPVANHAFSCELHREADKGESSIERMAKESEERRRNRVLVIFPVRKRLLTTCRAISEEKGYQGSCIKYSDLVDLKGEVQEEIDAESKKKGLTFFANAKEKIGFRKEPKNLMRVLDRAIEVVDSERQGDDAWFHFQDFSFYHTKVESRWPWMRNKFRIALLIIFFYYLFTTVFFCKGKLRLLLMLPCFSLYGCSPLSASSTHAQISFEY